MLYYLRKYENGDTRYEEPISYSSDWETWLDTTIPYELEQELKRRLQSNLKHILVGLEMKAGLIEAHNQSNVLFEPYHQILTFEFCLGTFSVCEGLGSAQYHAQNENHSKKPIKRYEWFPLLQAEFDPNHEFNLKENFETVKDVRDKLHQDRLWNRDNIDWHDLGYDKAYIPAKNVIECLLLKERERLPSKTNLI